MLKNDSYTLAGRTQFILLPKCGHLPWTERQAKDTFYATLRKILA
jgi:hypothetical protein